jgi:hypothetical protein
MEKFTGYPVFNWGSKFPFEEMYPVLGISTATLSNKIYSLGGFTLAPFSFAYAEQQQGRGLTKLLMDDKGISIIAREPWLAYLDIYCSEHFHQSNWRFKHMVR